MGELVLKVLKNKATGQLSVNIPKPVAELYGIDEGTKIILKPTKEEFLFKVELKK